MFGTTELFILGQLLMGSPVSWWWIALFAAFDFFNAMTFSVEVTKKWKRK